MFPERAALLNPTAVEGIISLESGYACAKPFGQADHFCSRDHRKRAEIGIATALVRTIVVSMTPAYHRTRALLAQVG